MDEDSFAKVRQNDACSEGLRVSGNKMQLSKLWRAEYVPVHRMTVIGARGADVTKSALSLVQTQSSHVRVCLCLQGIHRW